MNWLPKVCSHELLSPLGTQQEKLIVSFVSVLCSVRELLRTLRSLM